MEFGSDRANIVVTVIYNMYTWHAHLRTSEVVPTLAEVAYISIGRAYFLCYDMCFLAEPAQQYLYLSLHCFRFCILTLSTIGTSVPWSSIYFIDLFRPIQHLE